MVPYTMKNGFTGWDRFKDYLCVGHQVTFTPRAGIFFLSSHLNCPVLYE